MNSLTGSHASGPTISPTDHVFAFGGAQLRPISVFSDILYHEIISNTERGNREEGYSANHRTVEMPFVPKKTLSIHTLPAPSFTGHNSSPTSHLVFLD